MKKLIITLILTIVLVGCTTDNTAIKEQEYLQSQIEVKLENAKIQTNATNLSSSIEELEELLLKLTDEDYKAEVIVEVESLKEAVIELETSTLDTTTKAQAEVKAKQAEIAKVKAEEEAKALAEAKAKEAAAKKSTASTSKKSSSNNSNSGNTLIKATETTGDKCTPRIANSGKLFDSFEEASAWAESYADDNLWTISGYSSHTAGCGKVTVNLSYY